MTKNSIGGLRVLSAVRDGRRPSAQKWPLLLLSALPQPRYCGRHRNNRTSLLLYLPKRCQMCSSGSFTRFRNLCNPTKSKEVVRYLNGTKSDCNGTKSKNQLDLELIFICVLNLLWQKGWSTSYDFVREPKVKLSRDEYHNELNCFVMTPF